MGIRKNKIKTDLKQTEFLGREEGATGRRKNKIKSEVALRVLSLKKLINKKKLVKEKCSLIFKKAFLFYFILYGKYFL